MLGSDLESFKAAARRVRILDHREEWEIPYKVDPNIFRSLACAAQGTKLLPQL